MENRRMTRSLSARDFKKVGPNVWEYRFQGYVPYLNSDIEELVPLAIIIDKCPAGYHVEVDRYNESPVAGEPQYQQVEPDRECHAGNHTDALKLAVAVARELLSGFSQRRSEIPE